MFFRIIKKFILVLLIIVFFVAPSFLTNYLEYYHDIILGGVPTFIIYFLFWGPEIFFTKLLLKKPKKTTSLHPKSPLQEKVSLQSKTSSQSNKHTDIQRKDRYPKFSKKNHIYKQIMDACNQNISVYEEHIRTHLSDMESQNIEARTNAYMNARSAYLCSVIKSFLEIIYASHPSLYFTLVSMPELRKETPDITAGELYSQYMFALKGKRSKASIIRQLDSQQNKLMDEAMLRAVQQREIPTDKAEHHKEILSKLKNRNNIEEKQENEQEVSECKAKEVPDLKAKEEPAYRVKEVPEHRTKEVPERKTEEKPAYETEPEGSLSDDRRIIRIVAFAIAILCFLVILMGSIASAGGI